MENLHLPFPEKWLTWEQGRLRFVLAAILAVLSVALYAFTLGNPLMWDSIMVVKQDHAVHSLSNIDEFFTKYGPSLDNKEQGEERLLKYYRPVVRLIYALIYQVSELQPWAYHLANVLLNAAVVVLLFYLVRELMGNIGLAFAAVLLYAVNPARGEGVYWVYGLSSILMALFAILAVHWYSRRRHALALTAFVLALLSRESAVLLPVILVAYEFAFRAGEDRKRFLNVLPYLFVVILYVMVRALAVGEGPPLTNLEAMPLVNTIAVIVQKFIKITILPDSMVAVYPLSIRYELTMEVFLSWVVVATALGFGWYLWKNHRRLAFWYTWFFAWISIWFNVGRFGEYLMTEKGVYLAAAGLCVVAAYYVLRWKYAIPAIAAVVLIHGLITVARSTYWREPLTFFKAAVAFAPADVNAQYNLGRQYADAGLYREAADCFRRVVRKRPKFSMALNNYGNCLYMLKDRAGAFEMWKRAYASDPTNGEAAYNLGMYYEQEGDLKTALRYYDAYARQEKVPAHIAKRIREVEIKVRGMKISPGNIGTARENAVSNDRNSSTDQE